MGKGGMMTWDKEDLKNYLMQAKRITQKKKLKLKKPKKKSYTTIQDWTFQIIRSDF